MIIQSTIFLKDAYFIILWSCIFTYIQTKDTIIERL